MTAPSYRSSGGGFAYTSATVTLTKPSGVASGDVICAALLSGDYYRTLVTLPTGWSLVANIGDATAPAARMWVCKKVAGGSEPASYDFVFDFGFNGPTAIWAVQGGGDVSISGGSSSAILSAPYGVESPSVTVPDADSLLMWVGGLKVTTTGVDPTPTAPSGFTNRVDIGVSYEPCSIAVADKAVSSGASGALTGSIARTGAGDGRGFGVTLAISPTGGGTTVQATGEPALPVITAVVLSDTTVSMPTGNYIDVTMTVKDQDGATIQYLTGDHSSASESIATVSQLAATDSSGQATLRITAVAVGTTTVTVDFGGVTRTIAVEVVSLGKATITVSPATTSVATGATKQFTASSDDGTTPTVSWSITSGSGFIDSDGLFTAPSTAGTTVIRGALTSDPSQYATATVTVVAADTYVYARPTIKRSGSVLASTDLDYWVIDSTDEVIASGSGTTDSSGVLSIALDADYSGETVNVVVNNLSSDMSTAGKIQGQFVVVVS